MSAERRFLSDAQTAKLLELCPTTFRKKRETLEKAGFPKKDPLFGRYHRAAVESWLATRAGAANPARKDTLADRASRWGRSP